MINNPEKNRQRVGLALLIVGNFIGILLALLFLGPEMLKSGFCAAMCLGIVLAFPAAAMYLTVPRLLDRYDPEPWYALLGCLSWGAFAAAGFSLAINSTVGAIANEVGGPEVAAFVGPVISAPIVEEFFKALALFGMFYFLRREFDGVVDGIIYATFVALGFAAVENILYYGRAVGQDQLGVTFFARGILFPWGHPVYTSMTGIGFGLARESEKKWVQLSAPLIGYGGAVTLHAMWNGLASFSDATGDGSLFLCTLPIWFLFVLTFIVIIVTLVRRRGRVIRQYLTDEVAFGNISQAEVDLVCDAFGVFKARRRHGKLGEEFVRAAARLALSKWHSTRAHNQQKHTVSMDFIVPLRARLRELRGQLHARQQRR